MFSTQWACHGVIVMILITIRRLHLMISCLRIYSTASAHLANEFVGRTVLLEGSAPEFARLDDLLFSKRNSHKTS